MHDRIKARQRLVVSDMFLRLGGNDKRETEIARRIHRGSFRSGQQCRHVGRDGDFGSVVSVLMFGSTAVHVHAGGRAGDLVTGNAGNNVLDGGIGTDVMAGGAGNDRYAVDKRSTTGLWRRPGNGGDTVYASVDHQLDAHVETLILTGTAVRGFGSDEDNQIFGNDQVNVLYGRGGSDYMLGGGGDDIFVITAETGTVDVIGDFTGAGVAGGDRLSFGGFGAGAIGQAAQPDQLRGGERRRPDRAAVHPRRA